MSAIAIGNACCVCPHFSCESCLGQFAFRKCNCWTFPQTLTIIKHIMVFQGSFAFREHNQWHFLLSKEPPSPLLGSLTFRELGFPRIRKLHAQSMHFLGNFAAHKSKLWHLVDCLKSAGAMLGRSEVRKFGPDHGNCRTYAIGEHSCRGFHRHSLMQVMDAMPCFS